MSLASGGGLAFVVFGASLWMTGRFREYALARRLMDVPNERSSHVVETPRGGGVAIVAATLPALVALGVAGILSASIVTGLVGGGLATALLGFADDRGHIAPRWRLLGHFAAAAWMLAWVGGLPPVTAFGHTLHLGWLGDLLAAVYVVWMLNLTNFMDGIDGIAAVEAISVSLAGALFYLVVPSAGVPWAGALSLAAAVLGFLRWNWPRAKIFMGDAGSGFLGFMLAALSLQAAWTAPALLWAWLVLLGVFVVDATVTLLRRVMRGERFYEAHRSHAYQHAAHRAGGHRAVTLAVAAINVLWLLPIGYLVARGFVDGAVGVIVAYLPLVVLAVLLGAGRSPAR